MEDWLATHEHGRAIWIDDDLAWPATRKYFLENYSSNRLKLIAPDFSHGLTKAHLKEIREFAYPRTGVPKTGDTKPGGPNAGDSKTSEAKTDVPTTSDPKGTS